MNLRYRVDLDQPERDELTAMLRSGEHPARKLKRAHILLAAFAGRSDETIAATVMVGGSTSTAPSAASRRWARRRRSAKRRALGRSAS